MTLVLQGLLSGICSGASIQLMAVGLTLILWRDARRELCARAT
jgi:hypothetical protein